MPGETAPKALSLDDKINGMAEYGGGCSRFPEECAVENLAMVKQWHKATKHAPKKLKQLVNLWSEDNDFDDLGANPRFHVNCRQRIVVGPYSKNYPRAFEVLNDSVNRNKRDIKFKNLKNRYASSNHMTFYKL